MRLLGRYEFHLSSQNFKFDLVVGWSNTCIFGMSSPASILGLFVSVCPCVQAIFPPVLEAAMWYIKWWFGHDLHGGRGVGWLIKVKKSLFNHFYYIKAFVYCMKNATICFQIRGLVGNFEYITKFLANENWIYNQVWILANENFYCLKPNLRRWEAIIWVPPGLYLCIFAE